MSTDAKTDDDIIRLVKEEIGIGDDVEIEKQMMRTINRFSVSTDHQIKGKNIWKTKPQPLSKTNEILN